MAVSAILFTQEQARTLSRVSAGDLRHWRKSVPYLAEKPGKSARFTFADILGLAITRDVIGAFGVHITAIGKGIDMLFRLLADARPSQLPVLLVLVGADYAALQSAEDLAGRKLGRPALIVPCDRLIAGIRDQMIPFASPSDQAPLPFPPQVVKGGA